MSTQVDLLSFIKRFQFNNAKDEVQKLSDELNTASAELKIKREGFRDLGNLFTERFGKDIDPAVNNVLVKYRYSLTVETLKRTFLQPRKRLRHIRKEAGAEGDVMTVDAISEQYKTLLTNYFKSLNGDLKKLEGNNHELGCWIVKEVKTVVTDTQDGTAADLLRDAVKDTAFRHELWAPSRKSVVKQWRVSLQVATSLLFRSRQR